MRKIVLDLLLFGLDRRHGYGERSGGGPDLGADLRASQ